jgi:predicted permease
MASIGALLRNLFRKQRVERELDDEVHAFVDMKTDENIAGGMSPADARRAALIECGGVEQVKESVREVRAGTLLEQCWQDVRYGLRMLRKNPGFSVVAVCTIALGIGVNASIFSIFDSVTLRPLQLNEPNRLVDVYQTIHGEYSRASLGGMNLISYPDYKEYRDNNQVFSAVAAYKPELRVSFQRREISGQLTTCNYFDVAQVKPVIGRAFTEDECAAPEAGPVVVLSHNLWQNSFNSDPAILGKVIQLNHTSLTVIGVAPAEFHGTIVVPAQFWAPISIAPELVKTGVNENVLTGSNINWLAIIGRLKDGATIEQAHANLAVIAARIDQRTPNRQTTLNLATATLMGRPDIHRKVVTVGTIVLIAVGLVLLIACANIANLMLARAAGRTREVAVRLAMGASRGRLIRQLLTESVLIALLGGTLGMVVAMWSQPWLVNLLVSRIPNGAIWMPASRWPDIRIVAYALALTLLTGIAFGLAPALQSTRPDLIPALKNESGQLNDRSRRNWMGSALVAGQVAACMVLLISAGLLLRGLYHAQTVDPGFNMTRVGMVSYKLVPAGFAPERAAAFNRDMAARLRNIPGVEEVVPAAAAPLADVHYGGHFSKPGESERRELEFNYVGDHFFSILDIPLTRGRDFTNVEVTSGAAVGIINESAARQIWPGEDPVGKQLKANLRIEKTYEIVGVARDVQMSQLGDANKPYIFLPAGPEDQAPVTAMLIRTKDDFKFSAEQVRAAARAMDNSLTIDVAPLQDNVEQWVGPARICVALAGALGSLGIVLAAIGIYGTVSYSVSRRVREIGIRMALGARSGDVLSTILRRAMRPVVIGSIVGLLLCAGISKLFTFLLFGLSPFDPLAYLSVVAFLIGVALLASYVPARRALKVDPMGAIRSE